MGDIIQTVAGVPWPEAARALIADATWMVAGQCGREFHPGGVLTTFAAPMPDGGCIEVDVVLGIGPAVRDDELVRIPLSGHAPCGGPGFPTFDGFLEARPAGRGTGLMLHIGHHPPLGPLGADGDHVIGTRVLDVGLTRLLHQAARRLEAAIAPPIMVSTAVSRGAVRT